MFQDSNTNMNDNRNSDEPIVPATSANNGGAESPAEPNEERGSTKRNANAIRLVPDAEPDQTQVPRFARRA